MKKYLKLIILLISITTIFSGILQIISPGYVLNFIGADITSATKHFFAILGMFMALFGGMMIQALYSVHTNEAAVLWASFQKLGASLAVGLGIFYGIFNEFALSVAIFDLLSGCIILWYYVGERNND
ncbi:MAG: patatin [Flavobacterium sp.]|nr:patatin [Pedobacter sp.]